MATKKPGDRAASAGANAAIMYAVDGFDTSRPRLMGRHAAGEGFLRGFAKSNAVDRYYALVANKETGERFAKDIKGHKPDAAVDFFTYRDLRRAAEPGAIFLPGPGLMEHAFYRRKLGDQRAFSLCGITHTTASAGAMNSIVDCLSGPIQSWDAIICTSDAVRRTIERVHEVQSDYLKDRLGATRFVTPQLPVIPLGVDCDWFDMRSATRASWRKKLGIAEKDVVFIFLGRFSFHAKAHPLPMFLAAEAAAKALAGKAKVHLVQAGWFPNDAIEKGFRDGGRIHAPSVSCLYVDGRKTEVRREIWAAADIFISLSDNIQETFGLTPVEAMACGLPGIVSDWNGYKDTVRHKKDGFRIPTVMPAAPLGEELSIAHALEFETYDRYIGFASQLTGVDIAACCEAAVALAKSQALRQQLGGMARERARSTFDWRVVIGQYQELWAELAARRASDAESAKPSRAGLGWPARLDPFDVFAHYPTQLLTPATKIARVEGADNAAADRMRSTPISSYAAPLHPNRELSAAILSALEKTSPLTLGQLETSLAGRVAAQALTRAIAWMAKHDLVRVQFDNDIVDV